MNFIYNLSKKLKYLLLSLLTAGLLVWFSFSSGLIRAILPIITILIALLGTLFVQYTSFKVNVKSIFFNTFINIIALPVILILGTVLTLIYFPNLSVVVRVVAIFGVGVLMYITQLVDNVFLVVYERGEAIPLYRVATTWSQILMVVLAIPFYAGIFKVPLNSITQSIVVATVAGLFTLFMVWIMLMDPEVTDPSREERLIESGMVFFAVFTVSIGTSFIPTESFLRSLLVSAVLMASLGYIQAHHKNKINKKLILEYFLIIIVFLIFVLFIRQ